MPSSPSLSPQIVDDPNALGAAIGAFLHQSRTYWEHSRRILHSQRELHARLENETWQAYLTVEGATNARLDDATDELVRWAFSEGVKFGAQRRSRASRRG